LFLFLFCQDFDNQYYPEYLGKLYIINCPWVGPYLYSAVSVFLSDVIKQRLQIISDNPSEFLLSVIAPDQLPDRYGGNCTGARCNHGGVGGNMPEIKGCIDVLDSSKLKPAGAPDDSGLESQEISYDFEKEVTAENEGDVFTSVVGRARESEEKSRETRGMQWTQRSDDRRREHSGLIVALCARVLCFCFARLSVGISKSAATRRTTLISAWSCFP
jgi:hypothetical protein